MKCFLKKATSFCALLLSAALVTSAPAAAFATENRFGSGEEISDVLDKINAEYGTNIQVLTEQELACYGITATETQTKSSYECGNLEETLRYIAEVRIPQFKQITQEAKAILSAVSGGTAAAGTASNTVIAIRAIDYATAAVEAYRTTDSYGNTIWGNILRAYCETNIYQPTYFVSANPTAFCMDNNRTICWMGEGNYMAYINGSHYYLYSGTQYAYMSIEDYS